MNNIKSFYEINENFNKAILPLYESNDGMKLIKKYIKLISEDKILKSQYNLHRELKEGIDDTILYIIKEDKKIENIEGCKEYINEVIKRFSKFSKKRIKESNDKFYNLIKENLGNYSIIPKTPLIEAIESLIYEGDVNTSTFIKNKTIAINELNTTKKSDLIDDIYVKYNGKIRKEDLDILRAMVSNMPQDKLKTMLKEYQKKLLNDINHLIKEVNDIAIKERFLSLKEIVLMEEINNVSSVEKLFEIKQIIRAIDEKV